MLYYRIYWWNFFTSGNLAFTEDFLTLVFSWKVNPHLFLKESNHCADALKFSDLCSFPRSRTNFRMMILHHKAVTGNHQARLAVIRLTSSFCSSGKSPLFCLVCICLGLLVVAFFAIEIYFFLSFNHFLKVFQGQPCLSSHSCRSSGLINSTPSESHCKISLAFNKGVLKTFVVLFGICRTGERQHSSFTRTS